jgi:hypothetical protein
MKQLSTCSSIELEKQRLTQQFKKFHAPKITLYRWDSVIPRNQYSAPAASRQNRLKITSTPGALPVLCFTSDLLSTMTMLRVEFYQCKIRLPQLKRRSRKSTTHSALICGFAASRIKQSLDFVKQRLVRTIVLKTSGHRSFSWTISMRPTSCGIILSNPQSHINSHPRRGVSSMSMYVHFPVTLLHVCV